MDQTFVVVRRLLVALAVGLAVLGGFVALWLEFSRAAPPEPGVREANAAPPSAGMVGPPVQPPLPSPGETDTPEGAVNPARVVRTPPTPADSTAEGRLLMQVMEAVRLSPPGLPGGVPEPLRSQVEQRQQAPGWPAGLSAFQQAVRPARRWELVGRPVAALARVAPYLDQGRMVQPREFWVLVQTQQETGEHWFQVRLAAEFAYAQDGRVRLVWDSLSSPQVARLAPELVDRYRAIHAPSVIPTAKAGGL